MARVEVPVGDPPGWEARRVMAVLMIVAMTVLAAVPVIVVLRAPLWQEFHLGQPASQKATVTARVVRPIPSPAPTADRQRRTGMPRVIRGELEP
jgi:cytochrome c oxidase assembly factor CtaG